MFFIVSQNKGLNGIQKHCKKKMDSFCDLMLLVSIDLNSFSKLTLSNKSWFFFNFLNLIFVESINST